MQGKDSTSGHKPTDCSCARYSIQRCARVEDGQSDDDWALVVYDVPVKDAEGPYILYEDHEAALEQSRDAAATAYSEILARAEKAEALAEQGLTSAYMLARAEANDEIRALRAKNAKLREALAFYANSLSYFSRCGDGISDIEDDGGDKARAALGGE